MQTMTAAEILESVKPGASTVLQNLTDEATLRRIAVNLAAFRDGSLTPVEAAGVFSVNVDELLEIIERQARGRHARTV